MSQNPNDPNYNPYGQNPNYPNIPGTAYGGPAQPPSGPNPGYNPYPPSNPVPNSGYGPSNNPYAPPPPPGPITGPNPYDPYSPTVQSQNPMSLPGYSNPVSNPGYPAYNPQAGQMPGTPPMPMPPAPTPQKRNSGMIILITVIILLVVVGGSIFAAVAYNNNQQTIRNNNSTATAQTNDAHATATGQVIATASAVANNYPFSNKLLLDDPLVDNSKNVRWDSYSNQTGSCGFSGSAYHVIETDSRYYNTCSAIGSNYSNFTFEVQMVIKTGGNGAAGGLIFRADENSSKFYRLSIDTNGSYYILVSVDNTGTSGNARKLKEGMASSFSTGLGQTNALAIVARGSQYSFYVNQQLVTTFNDGTYTHGQIGFDVDYGTSTSELVFTNAKVWELS